MSTIEECKAAIAEHNEAIKVLSKTLEDLKIAGGVNELTQDEFKQRVKKLSDDRDWKEFIDEDDFLDNITSMLKNGYTTDSLLREDDEDSMESKVGELGSRKWQEFMIKVIGRLLEKGDLKSGGQWDSFEDTAGGCDESLFDACNEVIYGK